MGTEPDGVSAYKLLLVPEEAIVAYRSGDDSKAFLSLFQDEPYEVIGDIGPDRRIRMSRLMLGQIEIID